MRRASRCAIPAASGDAFGRLSIGINPNPGEPVGGKISFPEFGPQACRVLAGGALRPSGELRRRLRPVTRGCSFAVLPLVQARTPRPVPPALAADPPTA